MKTDSQEFVERASRELNACDDMRDCTVWAESYGATLIALAKKGAENG